MADPTMTNNNSKDSNQTMQHERAKSEVGGGSDRQREQGGMDKDREKNAVGGQSRSETGKSGRARDELDKSRGEPTGQR